MGTLLVSSVKFPILGLGPDSKARKVLRTLLSNSTRLRRILTVLIRRCRNVPRSLHGMSMIAIGGASP